MLIVILPSPRAAHDALLDEARAIGAALLSPTATGRLAAVNEVLETARARREDLLLVEADAIPAPGALAELIAAAATDPMIGFAHARAGDAATGLLPHVIYEVHAQAGCLLVRHAMIVEFGLLDAAFATVPAALADLSLRANLCGYRAVAAPRARVDMAPATIDAADGPLLRSRHPTLDRAIGRHAASAAVRAEALTAGLAPHGDGRLGLLFDCRMIGPYYSGTIEHARRLLHAFVARHGKRWACHILIGTDGYHFHRLDEIEGLVAIAPDAPPPVPIAVAFRLAQPFEADALTTLAAIAPVAGFLMLDTIALDCEHLDGEGLGALWQAMADCVAVLAFNSRFSMAQFGRRFAVPEDVVQRVSLCSTDVADYAAPAAPGEGVLMVGNHYPHKALAAALDALAMLGAAERTTVLGMEIEGARAGHPAGELPQSVVDRLYDETGVLLFPSHYEGFGLPVMNALARRRPVVARDLPCLREIAAATPFAPNLHLAADTETLAALAAAAPVWDETPAPAAPLAWGDAADALADAFEEAVVRFDFGLLRRRVARLATLASEASHARAAIEMPLRHALAGEAVSRHRAVEAAGPVETRLVTIDARAAASLRALAERLLDAVGEMVPGDRLRLRAALGLSVAEVRAALRAAGVVPDRVSRGWRRTTATGRLSSRWIDLLPGPADGQLFADYAHRIAVGRPANAIEQARDASLLDGGVRRRDMLRGLLLFDGRLARLLAAEQM